MEPNVKLSERLESDVTFHGARKTGRTMPAGRCEVAGIGRGGLRPRLLDPRDLRDAFAANLRRLRHGKGISQEDLAHEAGSTAPT
jgi:hypothetical protein